MSTKSDLRALALERRKKCALRQASSARACQRLLELPQIQRGGVIAAYVPRTDEISTWHLLHWCWKEHRRLALPRVGDSELELWQVLGETELEPATFGIQEPKPAIRSDSMRRIHPRSLEAIVVPGVAFDLRGGRIGYGKGHYDRLLAQLGPSVPRIGLAFESQLFDSVPQESHDVAMTHLVTPSRVVRCPSSATT